MKLKVDVLRQSRRWDTHLPEAEALVKRAARAALMQTRLRDFTGAIDLSALLTHNRAMTTINHQFRGKNSPTNVLSFPAHEALPSKLSGLKELPLGDLVLAFEVIHKEAKAQRKSLHAHVMHLVVHGTLHLLGYDHQSEREAATMEMLEIKALAGLKIANPYEIR